MRNAPRVLFVDDDDLIHAAVAHMFQEESVDFTFCSSAREALSELERQEFDILITDIMMEGMNGLELIEVTRAQAPDLPCIAITGNGNVQQAVEAIKLGAIDYLEKPPNKELLTNRINQATKISHLTRENRMLRTLENPAFTFDPLLGSATRMTELKRLILRIAPTDINILVQGETGTGKELVARAIHHHSLRREERFAVVDCTALNESLAESELFGHEKGAYTGATAANPGLIRTADGGTLFLDEVGELSAPLQTKFLRVLQEKTVRPVGGVRDYPVDVRVIAATNRDLRTEVDRGRFREDLFFRLNVVSLVTPRLRERGEDIRVLAEHFARNHTIDISPVKGIDEPVFAALERYGWPGNVRELQNVITRAVALGSGARISLSDLPAHIVEPRPGDAKADGGQPADGLRTMQDYEELAIRNALADHGGDKKGAAAALGIGLATLYRKIKQLEINTPEAAG